MTRLTSAAGSTSTPEGRMPEEHMLEEKQTVGIPTRGRSGFQQRKARESSGFQQGKILQDRHYIKEQVGVGKYGGGGPAKERSGRNKKTTSGGGSSEPGSENRQALIICYSAKTRFASFSQEKEDANPPPLKSVNIKRWETAE